MKILLVNHLLDPVSGGGMAEWSLQIAHQLAGAGGASSERRSGTP